jgi:hypothetical protein
MALDTELATNTLFGNIKKVALEKEVKETAPVQDSSEPIVCIEENQLKQELIEPLAKNQIEANITADKPEIETNETATVQNSAEPIVSVKEDQPKIEINEVSTVQEIVEHPSDVSSESSINVPLNKPKWQTLEKVSVLLSAEQKEGLDKIAKRIMRSRSEATKGNQDKERITANTLMRVLIDAFLEREKDLPMKIITNEDEARLWVDQLFKQNS